MTLPLSLSLPVSTLLSLSFFTFSKLILLTTLFAQRQLVNLENVKFKILDVVVSNKRFILLLFTVVEELFEEHFSTNPQPDLLTKRITFNDPSSTDQSKFSILVI